MPEELEQQSTLAAATEENSVPAAPATLGAQMLALGRYLLQTEVHTYAFSVAANFILSLFPFIVLLLTLARSVFHSQQMAALVADMLRNILPATTATQDFVVRNIDLLAHSHKKVQVFSLIALLVTSTGVFLPLEVALNRVWGVHKDRPYWKNQIVSLGLALCVGILAMLSVGFSDAQQTFFVRIFGGQTDGLLFRIITQSLYKICGTLSSIALFFLIYWILPNKRIRARAVLPAAVVVGLIWEVGKIVYIHALPWLDFPSMYGPFYITVGLMIWAFLSGLLLLAGAQFSAVRHATHETPPSALP